MPETENDEKDEKEKPTWIVEDGDKGHRDDGYEINDPALSPKKGIGDVTPVELSDRKEIERCYEEAYPTCVSDGMEHDVGCFGNFADNESLNE